MSPLVYKTESQFRVWGKGCASARRHTNKPKPEDTGLGRPQTTFDTSGGHLPCSVRQGLSLNLEFTNKPGCLTSEP